MQDPVVDWRPGRLRKQGGVVGVTDVNLHDTVNGTGSPWHACSRATGIRSSRSCRPSPTVLGPNAGVSIGALMAVIIAGNASGTGGGNGGILAKAGK